MQHELSSKEGKPSQKVRGGGEEKGGEKGEEKEGKRTLQRKEKSGQAMEEGGVGGEREVN